jgi:hypothetical protein
MPHHRWHPFLFLLCGYPEPECGAFVQFTIHAYLTLALVDDSLADRESETGALNVVVELDKAFKDAIKLVLGNASTCVLAIDVESLTSLTLLGAIAHTDMPLLGVLDGIGDKVGDDLLNTALVDADRKRITRTVTQELHARLLYTLSQRFTDVGELTDEVDMLRTYLHSVRINIGKYEDVVDKT